MADGSHFENRYIAISQLKNHPILMKFCTPQQILNWMNVTWSKIKKKLHWTDFEFDRTYFLFFLKTGTNPYSWSYPLMRRGPDPNRPTSGVWWVIVGCKPHQHLLATPLEADRLVAATLLLSAHKRCTSSETYRQGYKRPRDKRPPDRRPQT